MKFINEEILLRNRRVFTRARDAEFKEATRLLDDILMEVAANNNRDPSTPPPQLKEKMAELVDRLYYARYYARLSVGGDPNNVPAEIDDHERAFIDHVETMYSYSRSINRLLRHEFLIESFVAENKDVSTSLSAYLKEIRKSDVNLIYANLNSMRERMKLFKRYIAGVGETPLPTPAGAVTEKD